LAETNKFVNEQCVPVFFNLFVPAKPSANVCIAHGTLCSDPSVCITTTA